MSNECRSTLQSSFPSVTDQCKLCWIAVASSILLVTLASAFGSSRVIPTPHFIDIGSGSLVLPAEGLGGEIMMGESPPDMVRLAAELLAKEAQSLGSVTLEPASPSGCRPGPCIWLLDWSRPGSGQEEVRQLLSSQDLKVLDDSEKTGQAYVIRTDFERNRLFLVGSSPPGTLYAATTLLQLWSADSDGLSIPQAWVGDYPDFNYRCASDWLLRAELNRWAYDWGDGRSGFVKRVKRKLDFCLRFKINMVFFDGFGWNAEKVPGYGALMRELNAYARERGIKLVYAGFGANFDPLKVEPEFNIGRVYLNRRSYPDGPLYSCYGEIRTPLHPTLGTCRANEEQNRQIVEAITNLVRTVEPGALYIHHEDTGHYKTNIERWKTRDEQCKARWPNDDFAASDGGAGALAYRYGKIVESVRGVRNSDSGYDAARDCTIILISPPYGVDSRRSGLADIDTDEDLNWNKTLEYWANAVSLLPSQENVEVGFREIFPQARTSIPWMKAYQDRMTSLGLSSKVFMFFLGGADQYSAGVFNYPYAATPVMNVIFEGAEAIYNFSGGVHQEPLQVVNAQFSWNSRAPGYRQPKTFETTLAAWNALRTNEELPSEVFGPNGLFEEVCTKIYGQAAGKAMARFFHYFEPLSEAGIPSFYPRKVYPMPVLWRILQADSVYWSFDPKSISSQVLQPPNVGPAELHRRLAAFWVQAARVNKKGRAIVAEVRNSTDLREEARPDIVHLDRCLEVGAGFARVLASYHRLAADHVLGTPDRQQWKQTLALVGQLQGQLEGNFAFDTVDPKGGDLSSWTLALQELRNNLLALSQSHTREQAEFR